MKQESKKNPISEILFFLSIIAAVLGAIVGALGVLGKLPGIRKLSFARPKEPIKRSFQRSEGELRRG
ncbi:MAG: hypothetical protein IJX71_02590 [Oscillospiraceae bacterium]|nr:hypothetical protein [Oscillospiraceae bacterium]